MKKKELLDMPLGDRMKHYEGLCETKIDPSSHIIVRVDGHKFSSFSKGFKKPFDFILSEAMRLTSMDMLEEFNAVTAYVQSDEITLIIPSLMTTDKHKGANKPGWTHGYSGRIQKMSSLIAGFTTMKFNKHLDKLINSNTCDDSLSIKEKNEIREYTRLIIHQKVGNAWFDCRIYGVSSDEEAFNSVLWRVRDAEKNSRSMFAQTYVTHKQLHGLTGQEQVQFCKEKTGEDWELVEDRYKYGILVKKEYYMKKTNNPMPKIITADVREVQRTRVTTWAEKLDYSDENVELVMSKVR